MPVSPAGTAAASKLGRAFDRARGRAHQQLLDLDEAAFDASPANGTFRSTPNGAPPVAASHWQGATAICPDVHFTSAAMRNSVGQRDIGAMPPSPQLAPAHVPPEVSSTGRLSRTLDRVRGRGHCQHLMDLDESSAAGNTTSTPPGPRSVTPVAQAMPIGYPAGRPDTPMGLGPQTPARLTPSSAGGGKLSRAFERMRGAGHRQQLELDDEALHSSSAGPATPATGAEPLPSASRPPTAPLSPDMAIGQYDAASGPSLAAVTGFGLNSAPSTPMRSSPVAAAVGEPQPWLLRGQFRNARDVVSKLGRRGDEKSRML